MGKKHASQYANFGSLLVFATLVKISRIVYRSVSLFVSLNSRVLDFIVELEQKTQYQ